MQCWANWGLQRALGIGQIQTYGLKTGNEVSVGGKGSEQLMKGSLCAPLKCASFLFVVVYFIFVIRQRAGAFTRSQILGNICTLGC